MGVVVHAGGVESGVAAGHIRSMAIGHPPIDICSMVEKKKNSFDVSKLAGYVQWRHAIRNGFISVGAAAEEFTTSTWLSVDAT